MRMYKVVVLLIVLALSGITYDSNAELIDRGGGLIYDTDLNVTWLQNADLFGTVTWFTANSRVNNLVYYDSVRDVNWDDWRLPTVPYHDSTCSTQYAGNPSKSYGVNCTENEMGHLYYTELKNIAGYSATKNKFPFTNVKTSWGYWLSDDPTMSYNPYWYDWSSGNLAATTAWSDKYVWAVRDGDVATVAPEPISSVLFITGGTLLAGKRFIRRKA